jgi:hypothetical protein
MANFIEIETKNGLVYLNTEHIVSITEETDDDTSIVQLGTGQTINTTLSVHSLGVLLESLMIAIPATEDEESEDAED